MMVCINRTLDNGFFCSKYEGGKKVAGVSREFKTKEELNKFLLELPSPPIDRIEELMDDLNK